MGELDPARPHNELEEREEDEAQRKAMRAYAQSGQYHTIVESRVHLILYQSHAPNLVMSIESSNVEQRTPKEKESSLLEGIVKND